MSPESRNKTDFGIGKKMTGAKFALPVRILWKAVSTLVESRAEVSMKLRLFFSANA